MSQRGFHKSCIFEELVLPERFLLDDADAAIPPEVNSLNLKKCAMIMGQISSKDVRCYLQNIPGALYSRS